MSQRQPVQKRSRERIEQILLAAADQLAKSGNADDLTTTSVSKRSGVPVATIYRYFADRMAIIATLIDRETAEVDAAIVEKLAELEVVTLESLLEAMMYAHLEHFRASRRSVVLWFGARQSTRVLSRVDRRYKYMGSWLIEGAQNAGLVRDDTPAFGGELLVWIGDRTFEFMFREERTREEEDAILNEYLESMGARILSYATPAGKKGIPRDEFIAKAGEYAPDPGEES